MEKVFVWGIGSFYRNSLEKLKQYEVNGYIDNIAYKTCNVFNGKKIISSNEIERDMHVIIMSKNFVPMVYELIKKLLILKLEYIFSQRVDRNSC